MTSILKRGNSTLSRRSESGNSMVELALVLPILLLLLSAGLEFGRVMKSYARISAIAREIGTYSFRECSTQAYTDVSNMNQGEINQLKSDIDDCLEGVLTETSQYIAELAPDLRVYLSIYKHIPSESPPAEKFGEAGSDNSIGDLTKIQEEDFDPTNDLDRSQLLQEHRVLVYTEIHFQHTAFFPGITNLFSSNGGVIYAVTAI
jgi:hypothetical protein